MKLTHIKTVRRGATGVVIYYDMRRFFWSKTTQEHNTFRRDHWDNSMTWRGWWKPPHGKLLRFLEKHRKLAIKECQK